jgi:predicted  nucleic acid-binding Zn-ribbon protein
VHPDLERLIRLQELDTRAERVRKAIAELPARAEAVDARLHDRTGQVEEAKQRVAEGQAARRVLEKELAIVQSRLTKYKDQLMEVKTNKEYQAMQKEIAVAEDDVRSHEDRILEHMLQADESGAALKGAERDLAAERQQAARERADLDRERAAFEGELQSIAEAREGLVREIPAEALARFESIASKRGVAVAEARDGHCTICHVRLRPQIYNDVRRNDSLIQCESCGRLLYFAGTANAAASNA